MVYRTVRLERGWGGGVPAVEGGPVRGVSGQAARSLPGQRVADVVAGGRVGGGRGQLGGGVILKKWVQVERYL